MSRSDIHPRTARLLDLVTKNPSHGYLFVGRGDDSLRAEALECLARLYSNFGASTKETTLISSGRHQSIVQLKSIDGGKIKLATIKEALASINLTAPANIPYRLFLLEDADAMSAEAANSLLKVLEEPPAGVIFILTTTHADRLIPTIVSRLQTIDFLPVTKNIVSDPDFAAEAEAFLKANLTAKFALILKLHKESKLVRFVVTLEEVLQSSSMEEGKKFSLLSALIKAEESISHNVSPRLVCELIALEMSL